MNTILKDIKRDHAYVFSQAENAKKGLPRVLPLVPELSDGCTVNACGGSYWFTTKTREDVEILMRLAPKWSKNVDNDTGIAYRAKVGGVYYQITAHDGALPPTCKLVEREIDLPAMPAKTIKKWVVECETKELANA